MRKHTKKPQQMPDKTNMSGIRFQLTCASVGHARILHPMPFHAKTTRRLCQIGEETYSIHTASSRSAACTTACLNSPLPMYRLDGASAEPYHSITPRRSRIQE